MNVDACRLNIYKNGNEWKPYHHDKFHEKKNTERKHLSVTASFGETREVSFQNCKTKTSISISVDDGSVYTIGQNVNKLWKHSLKKSNKKDDSRISIVAWGHRKD